MKKLIILLILCVLVQTNYAQKKIIPVSQSRLTGITLPPNSKQDSRMLSEVSAKTLLEMEAKKNNAGIKKIEVLLLPPSTAGMTYDSLVSILTAEGWKITPNNTDKDYTWIEKESRYLIAFFKAGKTSTDLYFGELNRALQNGVATNQQTSTQNPVQQNNKQQTTQVTNNNTVNNVNYAFTSTRFDDGWVSTIYDDYVLVSKNSIKLYLSYIEKFNESDYSGTGKEKRHAYWNTYVSKYFITEEMRYKQGGALSDFSSDYIEGWATDRQTNEKRYILMILRIIPYTGTLTIIIASAPDEQQLRQQFPKADLKFDNDLLPMYGYNKFAVGNNDLVGKWSSNGGATMNWYSTVTGQNVGATGAVTADEFQFNNDQTYSSEHKGASGWVGAMNTFQQKYKGNYSVGSWELSINNRFEGKTEIFEAWFEALKGGRVLHLQNKQYSGNRYDLFKEK